MRLQMVLAVKIEDRKVVLGLAPLYDHIEIFRGDQSNRQNRDYRKANKESQCQKYDRCSAKQSRSDRFQIQSFCHKSPLTAIRCGEINLGFRFRFFGQLKACKIGQACKIGTWFFAG